MFFFCSSTNTNNPTYMISGALKKEKEKKAPIESINMRTSENFRKSNIRKSNGITEIQWNECEPNNTCCVHCETCSFNHFTDGACVCV